MNFEEFYNTIVTGLGGQEIADSLPNFESRAREIYGIMDLSSAKVIDMEGLSKIARLCFDTGVATYNTGITQRFPG